MINFILKKSSENSPHYNLTLFKLVHKRNGEIKEEPGDTIYNQSLDSIKTRLANIETSNRLNDDVSLKEYFTEFYKVYNEICELLKKTL